LFKTIVDLHNGKVDIQSKLGEGSEFTVFLPRVKVIKGQDKKGTVKEVTFEGIKILLVEDDSDSAGFIKYLYEQKGAVVDWVASVKAARERLTTNKYDLYIFDLSMPEEDGISLIKSLRAKKDITKAVALTAFVDTYYEKASLAAGFDMFLAKPSSLNDLLSVKRLLTT
jgi:CheY-like chemotaxis protein